MTNRLSQMIITILKCICDEHEPEYVLEQLDLAFEGLKKHYQSVE